MKKQGGRPKKKVKKTVTVTQELDSQASTNPPTSKNNTLSVAYESSGDSIPDESTIDVPVALIPSQMNKTFGLDSKKKSSPKKYETQRIEKITSVLENLKGKKISHSNS